MTKNEDLKACPFCGHHAEYDESRCESTMNTGAVMHHVGCSNCECIAYAMTDSFDRKSDAAKAWNTRPTVTPSDKNCIDDCSGCNDCPLDSTADGKEWNDPEQPEWYNRLSDENKQTVAKIIRDKDLITPADTAMEDAVTREDTEEQSSGKSRAVDDLLSTSSTPDGEEELALEALDILRECANGYRTIMTTTLSWELDKTIRTYLEKAKK